jgi:streptogramin lyase
MHLIYGTGQIHRKLRSAAAVLTIAAAWCLALPGIASATVSVSGIQASTALDGIPSGGNTLLEPAIAPAPDGSNAEWFVVSGQNQDLLSITPTGQQSRVGRGLPTDSGYPDNYASVDADGYDWVLDNDQGQPENVLYAVGAANSPSPGLNPVAGLNGYAEDMTLGPDGALYISDNAGGVIRCGITTTPTASCAEAAITAPFDGGAYAIGNSGASVWFTDAAGELGSYASPNTFAGPFATLGNIDPGTIVAAGNGLVYVAGGAASAGGANTQILAFNSAGEYKSTAASGLGNVVSMTVGPDGNLWFLDAAGNGSVGELNISSGAVSQYSLPVGLWLPPSGWRIAPGPSVASASGTGEVYFTGTTNNAGHGNAELGVVSGIRFPVAPGSLAFKPAVAVSRQHVAVLTLMCAGEGNAECAGRINLRVKAKVKVHVRAARTGGDALYRTITRVQGLSLGRLSYSVRGGRTKHVSVRLSNAAYNLLENVAGHRWTATVTSSVTLGTVTGTVLRMTGPTPAHKRR